MHSGYDGAIFQQFVYNFLGNIFLTYKKVMAWITKLFLHFSYPVKYYYYLRNCMLRQKPTKYYHCQEKTESDTKILAFYVFPIVSLVLSGRYTLFYYFMIIFIFSAWKSLSLQCCYLLQSPLFFLLIFYVLSMALCYAFWQPYCQMFYLLFIIFFKHFHQSYGLPRLN